MNTSFVGIHALFVSLPLWATVLLLLVITDCVMHFGRGRLEGLGYQVALSAKYGDIALLGVVFIAATILQRGEVVLPDWMFYVRIQIAVFLCCVLLGLAVSYYTIASRSGQWMDVYHDVVIAPMFLFFAIMLLPVIYFDGTAVEKFWTILFTIFWAILVGVDIKLDRMNQRGWIKRNLGVTLKGIDTSS